MEYSIKHIKEHKLDEKIATLVRYLLGINIDFTKHEFTKNGQKRQVNSKIEDHQIDYYGPDQHICINFPEKISSNRMYIVFYPSGYLNEIVIQKQTGATIFCYDADKHAKVISDKAAFNELQKEMRELLGSICNDRYVRVFVNDVAGQYFNPSDLEVAKSALTTQTVIEENKPELPQKTELEQQRDETKQKIEREHANLKTLMEQLIKNLGGSVDKTIFSSEGRCFCCDHREDGLTISFKSFGERELTIKKGSTSFSISEDASQTKLEVTPDSETNYCIYFSSPTICAYSYSKKTGKYLERYNEVQNVVDYILGQNFTDILTFVLSSLSIKKSKVSYEKILTSAVKLFPEHFIANMFCGKEVYAVLLRNLANTGISPTLEDNDKSIQSSNIQEHADTKPNIKPQTTYSELKKDEEIRTIELFLPPNLKNLIIQDESNEHGKGYNIIEDNEFGCVITKSYIQLFDKNFKYVISVKNDDAWFNLYISFNKEECYICFGYNKRKQTANIEIEGKLNDNWDNRIKDAYNKHMALFSEYKNKDISIDDVNKIMQYVYSPEFKEYAITLLSMQYEALNANPNNAAALFDVLFSYSGIEYNKIITQSVNSRWVQRIKSFFADDKNPLVSRTNSTNKEVYGDKVDVLYPCPEYCSESNKHFKYWLSTTGLQIMETGYEISINSPFRKIFLPLPDGTYILSEPLALPENSYLIKRVGEAKHHNFSDDTAQLISGNIDYFKKYFDKPVTEEEIYRIIEEYYQTDMMKVEPNIYPYRYLSLSFPDNAKIELAECNNMGTYQLIINSGDGSDPIFQNQISFFTKYAGRELSEREVDEMIALYLSDDLFIKYAQKITEDLFKATDGDPSKAREFLNAIAVWTAPWYKCFAPEKTSMLSYQHPHVNIPIPNTNRE